MEYSIAFSAHAVETYDLIFEQSHSRWGANIAADFELRVYKQIGIIQETPFIYQALAQDATLRKCVVHANCSFLYEVKDREIEIHFFWDNRQDPII
ncbi:type II toxin-antitoxin system RelE/ParE family toxin [Mucilaginibacter lutimaris]|uniref:Type II toxin-antitoxin system RelE/ParE family toxin n=1 Tax=Mucilaginibacter lutimaris TaxID=931629 RepID=A0ABW2ZAV0_9SPHI